MFYFVYFQCMLQVHGSFISNVVASKNPRCENLYRMKIGNEQSMYSKVALPCLFLTHSLSVVLLLGRSYYLKDPMSSVSGCNEDGRSMKKEYERPLTLFTCNAPAKYCAPLVLISQFPRSSVLSVCLLE